MKRFFSTMIVVLGAANMAAAMDQTQANAPAAAVTVKAVQGSVQPGGTVTVEAYVSGAVNVAAYQIQLRATGGSKGTLTLESMSVDKQRQDFAFFQAGAELIDLQDQKNEWLGLVRVSGGSDMIKPVYAATFVFRASADAAGVFKINVPNDNQDTYILDTAGLQVMHKIGAPVEVSVGGPAPVRTEGRK
jgi:hypothetical protein